MEKSESPLTRVFEANRHLCSRLVPAGGQVHIWGGAKETNVRRIGGQNKVSAQFGVGRRGKKLKSETLTRLRVASARREAEDSGES